MRYFYNSLPFPEDTSEIIFGVSCILFAVTGNISHYLVKSYREDEGGYLALYIFTFLPFLLIIVFVGIYALIMLILRALGKVASAMPDSSGGSSGSGEVCVVFDGKSERKLRYFDRGETVGSTREECKLYKRYRDDLGDFWRLYDGDDVYVKERPGQQSYEL